METGLDLRRQIAIVRHRLPLLIGFVLIPAIAAFALSSVQHNVYQAKATLIVGQSLSAVNPDINQLMVSQRLSTTYAAVATKRPALEGVISKLGLSQTPAQLALRVSAGAPTDSTLLEITAEDEDPAQAAAIANALAEQLIATSPAIQGRQTEFQKSIDEDLQATQDQINSIQAQVAKLSALPSPSPSDAATLETLQGRLVTLRSTYASLLAYSNADASNLLTVVEPAVAPTSPVSPKPLLNTLLAAVVGLLMGTGLIAFLEYLDDTVKDAETVQEIMGLGILGSIARMPGGRGRSELYRLATIVYPRSGTAEAFRALRTNIEFASVDAPIRTLLVTSSNEGEGKTVTASNLAIVFAQAGLRVILVDTDFRQPGIHRIFNVPNTQGLTSLLRSDEATVELVAQASDQANLRIVTTGPLPPNPVELLASQRMRAVLARLRAESDIVVFDAPPLRAVTDAAVLSSYLDAAVLVVDAGRTRRAALRQGQEALARAGAHVLGVVFNRVPRADLPSYYGPADEEAMADGPAAVASLSKDLPTGAPN